MIKKTFLFLFLLITVVPGFASAHQPRLVESRNTVVTDPEISKAYYGKLTGVPDTYTITSPNPFKLYVNVLVPDIENPQKDVSVTIQKDGKQVTVLDGIVFTWTKMFEPFGYDSYWKGPEYSTTANAGVYIITVTSLNNDSKYSLAIGEAENFNATEVLNALTLIPQLKQDFFNESSISFILSLFGLGLIIVLYILAFIFGFTYRFVLLKFAKKSIRGVSQNIGTNDRLFRIFIGVALLAFAITTSWSPLLIFFSGFAVFEGVFSWCGLYATIGKSTCPS